jgi:transposase-like protein
MQIGKRDKDFLFGLTGRRHWSEEDAQRVLALQEASGESRAGFARRHGMRATRIAWWSRRLHQSEDGMSGEAASQWVELVAAIPSGGPNDPPAARVRVAAVSVELMRLDAAAARFVVELARMSEADTCS